jgi:hypothetical protein
MRFSIIFSSVRAFLTGVVAAMFTMPYMFDRLMTKRAQQPDQHTSPKQKYILAKLLAV